MSDTGSTGSFEPPQDPTTASNAAVPPSSPTSPSSAGIPHPPTEPPAAGGEPPFAPPAAGGSSTFGTPGATGATPSGGEAPAPAAERSAPGWKAWVAAGAVAAVVAVGAAVVLGGGSDGSSSSGAAPAAANGGSGAAGYGGQFPGGGDFRAMGAAGTVTAIDGGTLSVEGQDGAETTVKATDDTTVTKTSDGELGDLAVGDNVLVVGETDGDAVAAQSITDNGDQELSLGGRPGAPDGQAPPEGQMPNGSVPDGQAPPDGGQGFPGGGPGGMPTAGEITKIDGETITIKTVDGSVVTVTTSDDTTVSVTETIEVGDIEVGDTISAMGETADDVVTAQTIRVGALGQGFPGGGPAGAGGPGAATGPGSSGGTSGPSGAGGATTVTGT